MKRVPDQSPAASELPDFLDDAPTTDVVDGDETNPDASEVDALANATDAATAPNDESDIEPDTTPATAEPTAADRPRRQRPAASNAAGTAATKNGGLMATMLGLATVAFGGAAALLPAVGAALPAAVGAGTLLVIGAVLFGVGLVRRRVADLERRLTGAEAQRTAADELLCSSLQILVDAHHEGGGATFAGEHVQQVLLALQRQDAKLNNLTKALKMYGKPLLDIAGQTTELAGSLAQVRALVEGGTESNRQATGRIETQLRTQATAKPGIAEVVTQLTTLEAAVRDAAGTASMPSLEPLQQQNNRLEVAVAAISQRLEDTEVRRSLLRLEDATQKAHKEVETLRRGDVVREVATQLQQRFDAATAQLAEGLARMRDGNLGGLENTVRDIQREIAGLATSVAQIQAAVKNAPRAAATPTALAASAPTPAPAPAPEAPTAAPAAGAAGNAGGYQTGARTSGSKNVLGAIAKLKQMKS